MIFDPSYSTCLTRSIPADAEKRNKHQVLTALTRSRVKKMIANEYWTGQQLRNATGQILTTDWIGWTIACLSRFNSESAIWNYMEGPRALSWFCICEVTDQESYHACHSIPRTAGILYPSGLSQRFIQKSCSDSCEYIITHTFKEAFCPPLVHDMQASPDWGRATCSHRLCPRDKDRNNWFKSDTFILQITRW
jgi:hypothetical protein